MMAVKNASLLLLLIAPGCVSLAPKVPSFTANHPTNPEAKEGAVAVVLIPTTQLEETSQITAAIPSRARNGDK